MKAANSLNGCDMSCDGVTAPAVSGVNTSRPVVTSDLPALVENKSGDAKIAASSTDINSDELYMQSLNSNSKHGPARYNSNEFEGAHRLLHIQALMLLSNLVSGTYAHAHVLVFGPLTCFLPNATSSPFNCTWCSFLTTTSFPCTCLLYTSPSPRD